MEGKTLDEIGHHYGFSDRQPIMRLFKKFGIKTRSKSENARKQSKPIPSADEVSSMIANKSISAAAKEFGYTRQTMTRFVETYGLKPNYFVNKDIRDLIVDSKFDNSSPKEIALELDTEISVVKYYRKNFPKVIYNRVMPLKIKLKIPISTPLV
jgi:AraC-like DNA-binding protein